VECFIPFISYFYSPSKEEEEDENVTRAAAKGKHFDRLSARPRENRIYFAN
jgi:hypothetical protein